QQFLSRSRFTQQQNTRIGSRHESGLFNGALKGFAASDHLRSISNQFAKPLIFLSQVRLLDRILDYDQHSVARQRLFEEIKCTGASGLDSIGNRAVTRNHDDWSAIIALAKSAQEIDTVAVGKPHIEQVRL